MEYKLMIQSTPNPNALKFVTNVPVKTQGNVTYKSADQCQDNTLAQKVFDLSSNITEVYFFDNYITVTQNGQDDWDELEQKTRTAILENIEDHNPDFEVKIEKKETAKSGPVSPEVKQIDAIIDETVRPALQMDGGDLQVVDYVDNTVKVFYQGACGSCPSATMGTLMAIENILKDRFNPDIKVEIAETF